MGVGYAAEVAVLESGELSFEGCGVGAVDEALDHRDDGVVTEDLAQRPMGSREVTIREARS